MIHRLKYLFNHSFFISLCAAALCWETSLLLAFKLNIAVVLFVFSATLFTYNAYVLQGSLKAFTKKDTPFNVKAFFYDKKFTISIVLLSGLAIIYQWYYLSHLTYLMLIAGLFTLLYFIPLFPKLPAFLNRKYAITKPLLLAGTWSFVTVLFPIYACGNHFPFLNLLMLITERLLFIFLLCLIFDTRDIAIDRQAGIKTIATSLSRDNLNRIFFATLVLHALISVFMDWHWTSHAQTLVLLLSGALSWGFYLNTKKAQGYYFYYFGVDGLMLLSAFAVYLTTI
jgi:hypothetical protein